jgi:hypothetical protein
MKTVHLAAAKVAIIVFAVFTPVLRAQPVGQGADGKLDPTKIDLVLGRAGAWQNGNYVVTFLRPDLRVTLNGVQLAPGHVHSFATFMGTDSAAEMMGDVCALAGKVTAAVEALRSNGIEVTGIHDHFLGESPTLTFIHFYGRGATPDLARAFRAAIAAAATPLLNGSSTTRNDTPIWITTIENVLGRKLTYSAENRLASATVPRADMPSGPMDSMYSSSLKFQNAANGRVLAIGDLALTADEVN